MSCASCGGDSITTVSATEDSSAFYEFDLVDQVGAAVPLASVFSWDVKLYDKLSGAVINSRSQTSILNTAGGTFDSAGHGTFTLAPEDNPILGNSSVITEEHIALFHITWDLGAQGFWWYIRIKVRAIAGVPS